MKGSVKHSRIVIKDLGRAIAKMSVSERKQKKFRAILAIGYKISGAARTCQQWPLLYVGPAAFEYA